MVGLQRCQPCGFLVQSFASWRCESMSIRAIRVQSRRLCVLAVTLAPKKAKSRQLLPDYNLLLTPLVSVLGPTVVLEREISPLFSSFTTDCISSDFIKIFQHMPER